MRQGSSPKRSIEQIIAAYDEEAEATGWFGPEVLFGLAHKFIRPGQSILDIGIGRVEGKHKPILQALSAINPDEFSSRNEIRLKLENMIESPAIRQFLLKNILRRLDGSLAWKFNRDAILEHYDELSSGLNLIQSFSGSVLFLRGENSDYLEASLSPEILHYFPFAQIQTIPDAGHWLHADKPKLLSALILNFLK